MEEFIYYGLLFDIYKTLLNNKSQEFFRLYYEENLTMQEIADEYKVSKSYVGSVIKKTEKKLDELENNLKIYEHRHFLANLIKLNDIEKIKQGINKILD